MTKQSGRIAAINYPVLLYLLGATIQVALTLYSLLGILLLLRRSKKINVNGSWLAITRKPTTPFCFGRRIVLSGADFRNHAKEVILHEKAHLRELHGIDLLLVELTLILTWYNPASWLLRRELRQIHEFEADSYVLHNGVDASDYQLLLVKTAAGESRFNLANNLTQSSLKTRIAMMNKSRSKSRAIFKALLLIPLIALMLQGFARNEVDRLAAMPIQSRGKYLQLTPDQMKSLGFEINTTGLFYKNTRFGMADKGVLCLYFTADTYSAGIILRSGEKIQGHSAPERILKKQPVTDFDFYPVVVASFDGHRTQDMSAALTDSGQKLLPVQVNMADMNLGKRADTLVFWLTPTESLKRVLKPIANMDAYLQVCPPDPGK